MRGRLARLTRLTRRGPAAATPGGPSGPDPALLAAAVDAAPVGIVLVDHRTATASLNAAVLAYAGSSGTDDLDHLLGMVHPSDRHVLEAVLGGSVTTLTEVVRVVHPTLGLRHVRVAVAPIDDDGEVIGAVAILHDVDEHIGHSRQLEQFRAVADTTTDVVAVASMSGGDDYLNQAGRQLLGVDHVSLLTLGRLVAREDHAVLFGQAVRAVSRGATWSGELTLIDARGGRRPMSVAMTGLAGPDGRSEAFALICRDVTEQRRLESRLAFAAGHDPLTGLPNRQQLLDTLSADLDAGAPIAVLFGGVDGFKYVNDSLGHPVGDRILRSVAERLTASARPDDLVARLGGDEFVVVCRGVPIDPDGARAVAQRCIDAVAAPVEVDGREHVVAVSVGIAIAGHQRTTASELLQEADLAMHSAKTLGRGRVAVFDSEMRIRADERVQLESDLRRALDHDEIVLRFQPIVHTGTGTVSSFEALARWHHPTRGMLMPKDFMPIVEAGDFATAFGEVVITQATEAAAALRAVQPDVTTAVNLSPRQLLDDRLVTATAHALRSAGLSPEALTIEITEEIVMDQLHAVRPRLDALRALGVRFAIDDFGTGYSNLSMLRQFEADYVKIDRSLVGGEATLLRLVLSLTGELGFASIAEGVETVEQLGLLHALGCSLAQGYYIAEPLELDDALAFLSDAGRSPAEFRSKEG